MAFNINDIRSNLRLDGARPSLFTVEIENPFNNSAVLKIPFMVKASSLPARNLGQIEVPYFGRTVKVGGDSAYDNWAVQVINDEDFQIKDAMEEWVNAINSPIGNIRKEQGTGYKSTAIVTQYGKTGNVIRKVRIDGIFPINVSEIGLAWAATNQLEEFSVTFSVDEWVTIDVGTGNSGGE